MVAVRESRVNGRCPRVPCKWSLPANPVQMVAVHESRVNGRCPRVPCKWSLPASPVSMVAARESRVNGYCALLPFVDGRQLEIVPFRVSAIISLSSSSGLICVIHVRALFQLWMNIILRNLRNLSELRIITLVLKHHM